jgi:hypothetical protein
MSDTMCVHLRCEYKSYHLIMPMVEYIVFWWRQRWFSFILRMRLFIHHRRLDLIHDQKAFIAVKRLGTSTMKTSYVSSHTPKGDCGERLPLRTTHVSLHFVSLKSCCCVTSSLLLPFLKILCMCSFTIVKCINFFGQSHHSCIKL